MRRLGAGASVGLSVSESLLDGASGVADGILGLGQEAVLVLAGVAHGVGCLLGRGLLTLCERCQSPGRGSCDNMRDMILPGWIVEATLSPALLTESVACSMVDFWLSGLSAEPTLSEVSWRLYTY